MSRKKRAAVQEAVVALRRHFGMTQQQLATEMNVGVMTISRWETSRVPTGFSLFRLLSLARNYNLSEIASVFEDAWSKETNRIFVRNARILPSQAAAAALGEIRAASWHPVIGPEYAKILRLLESVLQLDREVMGDSERLKATSQNLKKELEELAQELKKDEEKRTQTKG
jgi:transcriptional regulator with XRE-family HTH domain